VGFLAQENPPVPFRRVPGGSIARIVDELAHELVDGHSDCFDVTVCSLPYPELAEGTLDDVCYLRVGSAATADVTPPLGS
jgi:hypothetical protein